MLNVYIIWFHWLGTFAVICLMVGDATSRYIDAHPSLCEVVSYNDSNSNYTPIVTKLDVVDCPKALEVVFTITFATGLIMVRLYVHIYIICVIQLNVCTFTIIIIK